MTKELEHDYLGETVDPRQDAQYYLKGWETGYGVISEKKNVLHKNLKSYKGNMTILSP